MPLLLRVEHGLPTTWHKLCVLRSFPKRFQQADRYGNALVGELMVAFLLVFIVLRTAVNHRFRLFVDGILCATR